MSPLRTHFLKLAGLRELTKLDEALVKLWSYRKSGLLSGGNHDENMRQVWRTSDILRAKFKKPPTLDEAFNHVGGLLRHGEVGGSNIKKASARPYKDGEITSELGDLVGAVQNKRLGDVPGELDDIFYAGQRWYGKTFDSKRRITGAKARKVRQREDVWREAFARHRLPFSPHYLSSGDDFTNPTTVRNAFLSAGKQIDETEALQLSVRMSDTYKANTGDGDDSIFKVASAASIATQLRHARNKTHTHPTPGQAHAGNYAKGSLILHGLAIKLENPKGTERRGYDKDGNITWRRSMAADYGYFHRSMAVDGDAVDCFIGPDIESHFVLAVDQVKSDGSFDETKFVLGCTTQEQAEKLYLAHYPRGWNLGPTSTTTVQQLKAWLKEGDTKSPFKGQLVKAAARWDKLLRIGALSESSAGRLAATAADRSQPAANSLMTMWRDARSAPDNLVPLSSRSFGLRSVRKALNPKSTLVEASQMPHPRAKTPDHDTILDYLRQLQNGGVKSPTDKLDDLTDPAVNNLFDEIFKKKASMIKSAFVKQDADTGKWILWTRDKKRKLGTHDTPEEAYAQEYAIQKSQDARAESSLSKEASSPTFSSYLDSPKYFGRPGSRVTSGMLLQSANRNGVDPRLLAANESGWGTHRNATSANNFTGMMVKAAVTAEDTSTSQTLTTLLSSLGGVLGGFVTGTAIGSQASGKQLAAMQKVNLRDQRLGTKYDALLNATHGSGGRNRDAELLVHAGPVMQKLKRLRGKNSKLFGNLVDVVRSREVIGGRVGGTAGLALGAAAPFAISELRRHFAGDTKAPIEKAAVVKQDDDTGKWILWTRDKKRKLGAHDTPEEAYAQEYAIQKRQEARADFSLSKAASAPTFSSHLDSPKYFGRPGSRVTSSMLLAAAQRNGVDPRLLAAIAANESGWGTHRNATSANNFTGMMGSGNELFKYDTPQAGLDAAASLLKRRYVSKGLNTPEKIGPVYAPTVKATNDPKGINNNWVPTVNSILSRIPSPAGGVSSPTPDVPPTRPTWVRGSLTGQGLAYPTFPTRPLLVQGSTSGRGTVMPTFAKSSSLASVVKKSGPYFGAAKEMLVGNKLPGLPEPAVPIGTEDLTQLVPKVISLLRLTISGSTK